MTGVKSIRFFLVISILIFNIQLLAASDSAELNNIYELIRYQDQYSLVKLQPARMDNKPGIAVIFEGTGDLHYYAEAKTAPAEGLELKIKADSKAYQFGNAIFPKWELFKDATGQKVEVYEGNFTVFIPINKINDAAEKKKIDVTISGIACTSMICLAPFEKTISTEVYISENASLPTITFDKIDSSASEGTDYSGSSVLPFSTPVYFILAILAGISINIMPCVLPIIPLIIMRLIEQSKESGRKRIVSGMAFCSGVIAFFAVFAIVSAIINITTGSVIDLNSLFRYPSAVIVLFLLIVFFALVMFDIVTIVLPPSIMNKQNQGSGIIGSLGMGFFAGILSTPCSGALLGFVLVWAQTQPLLISSIAIILMGFGMALPYAVVVLVPSLLNWLPKPGAWMDIFKKFCGFLLFFVAVRITLVALPKDRLLSVLTYSVIFSFAVWMWGQWVSFSTPSGKKWAVRLIAVLLAVVCGFWLLPTKEIPAENSIQWQDYDAELINKASLAGHPVLIKFTADWCTNCKVVEKVVYQNKEVVQLIKDKNILAVKADTTVHDYQATIDFKKIYGEAGNVPVTIFMQPGYEIKKLRGIFDKNELIMLLKELPGDK